MGIKRLRLNNIGERFRSSEFAFGIFLSVVIGIASGAGAFVFQWLIVSFQKLFFDGGARILAFMGHYYIILLPAIGGVILGLIIHFSGTREAKGHGVPEVMEAVTLRGGRIRSRVAVVKTFASAICIGSGGSVGGEGPIIQIGATIGSVLGQKLNLSSDWIKTLVASGAAGGISAVFNAPIAGTFFAHEVILGRMFTRHFGFVVISSVIANAVAHALPGEFEAFNPLNYELATNWGLILFFLLGAGCALVAFIFMSVLDKTEGIFDKVKLPDYIKPGLGGIAVGVIGLYNLHLLGTGYDGIEQALLGKIGIATLGGLLVFKILATSFTLGSGGSGGVFAPSLFLGVMFGGAFGDLANRVLPTFIAPSGAFAMVGMAAVFAAMAHAPITAILIVTEMTRNYAIILPLMMAVVVSTFISVKLNPESIYTAKHMRRGINLHPHEEVDVLEKVIAADVMACDFPSVAPEMKLTELADLFSRKKYHGYPVIDKDGNLKGVVTLADIEARLATADKDYIVADIATKNLITAYPDESLHDILHNVEASEIGLIPVVDRENPAKLIGILRRHDIIRAYARARAQTQPDII